MVSLREANEKFCKGAAEIRYIYRIEGRDVFSKKTPKMFDPSRIGVMRSVAFAAPGEYLLVMDIDGIGLTKELMDAAARAYDMSEADERPLVKDSGIKGVQLIWKVIFPDAQPEDKASKLLELLAWEKYNIFRLEEFGISFGPPGTDKPHVDTSMFRPNHMIRGFCTRFNGKFSVPLLPHDDLWTAELRRSLVDELPDYEMGTIIFTPNILTFGRPRYREVVTDAITTAYQGNGAFVPANHLDLFRRLPTYFKALLAYEGDPHHNKKRLLVWYLFRMGLNVEDTIAFIWDTAQWEDLNSLEKTIEHVQSLRKTYDRIIEESGSFTFPGFVFD